MKRFTALVRTRSTASLILALAASLSAQAPPFPTNALVARAESGRVSLEWNASPGTNVTGYLVYAGLASRGYTAQLPTTNTTFTLSNLPPATYYFAVTARASAGVESEYSNEVTWTVAQPPAPIVRTLALSAVLKSSDDPARPRGLWTTVHTWPPTNILPQAAARFYTVEVEARDARATAGSAAFQSATIPPPAELGCPPYRK